MEPHKIILDVIFRPDFSLATGSNTNRKIHYIKEVRAAVQISLKESKDLVEAGEFSGVKVRMTAEQFGRLFATLYESGLGSIEIFRVVVDTGCDFDLT